MAKQEVETPKAKGAIVADPELNAMNRCNKVLMQLDDATRLRVVRWLGEKHGKAAEQCQA